MPDEINEAQEALSGLNDEDKKILEDLQTDGFEVEGLNHPEAAKEPEKEKEPEQEPEDLKGKESEPEKCKQEKKEPSLMPRWEHVVAEKQHEKEKAELQSKIDELQTKLE